MGGGSFCCVPFCSASKSKCRGISFHRIPKDKQILKEWIFKIRRDVGSKFQVRPWTYVCSRHFTEDSFRTTHGFVKVLKADAIPTKFEWNNWGQAKSAPRKEPLDRGVLTSKTLRQELQEDRVGKKKDNSETLSQMTYINTANSETVEKDIKQIEAEPHRSVADDDSKITKDLMCDQANSTELAIKVQELQKELAKKHSEIEALKIERFGISRFMYDDEKIVFYTGFSNYGILKVFFVYVSPCAINMRYKYYDHNNAFVRSCTRSMSLIDEFFMFLLKIRLDLQIEDLADRFSISPATVSRKIITWSNFLYFTLGEMNYWLNKADINNFMPQPFKNKFPNARVIIDCTEIRVQSPSSLVRSSQLFSSYKNCHTLKALIGIAPHGVVTFVSKLWGGNVSDNELFKVSGILDLLESGDCVLADKGFLIKKLLESKGITLNTPNFLPSSGQFSPEEIDENKDVSALRVHIERFIRKIKVNKFFSSTVPVASFGSVSQMFTVAVLLTNFQNPLVKSFF